MLEREGLPEKTQMANPGGGGEDREERWVVKALKYLASNRFTVFWSDGSRTIEPIEHLDQVHSKFISAAIRLQPKMIIISFNWIRKKEDNNFSIWITDSIMFSNVTLEQLPNYINEVSKCQYRMKTRLLGSTTTEQLRKEEAGTLLDRPVSGGCFQRSLSEFLEQNNLEKSPLFKKLGESSFVDILQVKETSEREDWPFRFFKVSSKTKRNTERFLKVEGDHCELVNTFDASDSAEYWEIILLKRTKKRMRNWT